MIKDPYLVKYDIYQVKLLLLHLVVESPVNMFWSMQFISLVLFICGIRLCLEFKIHCFSVQTKQLPIWNSKFPALFAFLRQFYCIYRCLSSRIRLLHVFLFCCYRR
jgi:hypothetical protein